MLSHRYVRILSTLRIPRCKQRGGFMQEIGDLQMQMQMVQAQIIELVSIGENTTILDDQYSALENDLAGRCTRTRKTGFFEMCTDAVVQS